MKIGETVAPRPTLEDFVERGNALNIEPNSIVAESDQAILNDKQNSIKADRSKRNQIILIKDFY